MRDDKLVATEKASLEEGEIPSQQMARLKGEDPLYLGDRWRLGQCENYGCILQIEDEGAFDAALDQIEQVYSDPEIKVLNAVVDPLGIYQSGPRIIRLDPKKISECARIMTSSGDPILEQDLWTVVKCHEEAHALHHLAQDWLDGGRIWDAFAETSTIFREILAQLFTFQECSSDQRLLDTFHSLEKLQPIEYSLYRIFRCVPKEVLYWLIRERPQRINKFLERMGFRIQVIGAKRGAWWNKLKRIPKVINRDKSGRICGEDMCRIISEQIGEQVNCYPGLPGDGCHKKAVFISITTEQHANPDKGHLSFRQVLECFVQHMQGHCRGITEEAAIMADSWDSDVWQEWQANIRQIKLTANVQIYLMVEDKLSTMNI